MIGLRSGQAVRGSEFRYRAPAALCLCLKAAAAGARRRSGSAPVRTLIRAPDGIRGIPDRAGSAALTFPFANRSNAPYSLIGTLLRIGIIHKALDAGLNFVDTADASSRGESEEIVGQALKGRRDDVVLATMRTFRWLIRPLEDSVRRLQAGQVDLFQVHRPRPGHRRGGNRCR